MGDQAAKILEIIAVIAAVCIVIGIGFRILNKGAAASDMADKQITELTNAMEAEKYLAYEKNNLSGSDVLGAINNFKSDIFCITVDNGYSTVEYGCTASDLSVKAAGKLSDAKDKTKLTTTYIDPSDSYIGEIMYDNSGSIIIGLKFTKN